MSIDHLTGDFYVADVGEWLREEVNYLPADQGAAKTSAGIVGGTVDYSLIQPGSSLCVRKTPPTPSCVPNYDHSHGECSIIGAQALYRGAQYPASTAAIFGDWCTGQLWTMYNYQDRWAQKRRDAKDFVQHFGRGRSRRTLCRELCRRDALQSQSSLGRRAAALIT